MITKLKLLWKKIMTYSLLFLAIAAIVYLFYREATHVLATPITAWQESHNADCAIVLTGGHGRVREGFDLLSRQAIRKLIIAGVHPQATLREIFPRWPYYENLDEKDVVLEKRSGTTYGNALQTLSLVEALHCRDVILITSNLHMYRARRTFQAIFPPDFPMYFRAIIADSYSPSWINVAAETAKSAFYSIWVY
jgi:uncharacterized SAM-binding protein YcdF (DUF218 family)